VPIFTSRFRGNAAYTGHDGQHGRGRADTEPGDFLVAKLAAIGPALQGVAAAHHTSVDPGHGERRHPHPQLTVIADALQVTFVAQVGFGAAIGAERVGVGDHLAAHGTGPHLLLLPHQRRQRPAADPAPHTR